MRYCHECGAEVAPEDTFCAYCGIALQPIQLAQNTPQNQSPFLDEKTSDNSALNVNTNETADGETFSGQIEVINAEALESVEVTALENQSENLSSTIDENQKLDEPETVLRAIEFKPAAIEVKERAENLSEVSGSNNINFINEDLQPTLPNVEAQVIPPSGQSASEKAETVSKDFLPAPDTEVDFKNSEIVSETIKSSEEPVSAAQNSEPQLATKIDSNTQDVSFPIVLKESQSNQNIQQEAARLLSVNAEKTVEKATPRYTEANKSQETPGGNRTKLKPLNEGTLLNNRYEIVRRIGGGGMGAVYLAKDQNLGGVQRAVKEMIQAYVDESQQEKAVQDFRRESLLLSQLEHSSIPTIYDYFYDEQAARFYLVMKYISGGDLAARLRSNPSGRIDERHVTEWAIQVADVLDYLHTRPQPIVYRDLKPSNIMLDGSTGKAMLIDYGIARWVNKEEKGVTAVGTMGYAPPELFSGNAEPRSDIYSLGATMFHLLTGADPQSNPLLIFDFNKNPRPRKINPGLSVEMEDILLKAVEYNSSLRFESAAKMRDALQQHLEKIRTARLSYVRKDEQTVSKLYQPQSAPIAVPSQASPINMIFCGFCGEKIVATDMFCAYCGGPQQVQSRAQTEVSGSPFTSSQKSKSGVTTARLVVVTTNELDSLSFTLEKESNLVGREDRRSNIFPEVDLTKFDVQAKVSRRHARIWREGTDFLVEDLKSSNGTVLITDNNKNVRLQANEPHILRHGDKLRLGETILSFYLS